ncbi:hypothetical protein PGN35_026160 [Nodosilinea sp. PGN35]|uniref:hypothetical protein n=1 Tax=Nodosilinea sp. PGN35 TaxID=3020489 RepID=UPI0023B29288|nr:hypothetical protein [Nodosilinea sp. TSF1-S3]MDF0367276.1 hypothetical protein [Nodosilinea sp. TSF1-S3]
MLRLLDSDFLDAQQVFVDQLPEPLPEQAGVVASVVYHAAAANSNLYRILLDSLHFLRPYQAQIAPCSGRPLQGAAPIMGERGRLDRPAIPDVRPRNELFLPVGYDRVSL